MNNKKVPRRGTSAIFLAIILVAGTITAFFPSFMVGTAQASPYYGMDSYDKKPDKKNVSVSSLKCNNINVNINGLELDVLPPFLGGEVTTEAAEGSSDASSFAADNNGDGSQFNDFRFICINNNNNTVIGGGGNDSTPIPPTPPEEECAEADEIEACFEEFLLPSEFELLADTLASPAGLTAEILGQEVTLRSFNDICEALEGTPYGLLTAALVDIVSELPSPVIIGISGELADCIAESLGIPIPPPPPPPPS